VAGLDADRLRFHQHPPDKLAHYAKAAFDIEFFFGGTIGDGGWGEIEGIHNRTDFDLRRHQEHSGKRLEYIDPATQKRYLPYIIETSAGADRVTLAVLANAYREETVEGETRVVLGAQAVARAAQGRRLPAGEEGRHAGARHRDPRGPAPKGIPSFYDESGAIGRRYRRQDEAGTPFCLTVDGETMEHGTVTIRDREVVGSGIDFTPRQVGHVLALTADPDARRSVENVYDEDLEEHRFLAEEVVARHREGLAELGYGSHVGTLEVLGGLDLRAIARDGENFLRASRDLYDELLRWYLPRITGVTPGTATAGDGNRLERAPEFDPVLRGGTSYDELLGQIHRTGLDPHADGRILLDRNAALAPGVGAICHAPRIPTRVRLAIRAEAGRPAWVSFLESLGVALHQGFTDPTLPIEQRYLGDESVPAASGALFTSLLAQSPFLTRLFGLPRVGVADFRRLEALLQLVAMRREVARFQYGLAFYSDDAGPEVYADLLTQATGLRHDPRAAIWDVEPELGAARRIRATQLGAVHASVLRERYDEDWFRNPAAGGYLRDLFSNGRRYTAQELAVQLGSPVLGFQPWLSSVEELAGAG
jgi:hypothetical protein